MFHMRQQNKNIDIGSCPSPFAHCLTENFKIQEIILRGYIFFKLGGNCFHLFIHGAPLHDLLFLSDIIERIKKIQAKVQRRGKHWD